MWVGLCFCQVAVSFKGIKRRSSVGAPFSRLFGRFVNDVKTKKFDIEHGRLICQLGMAEKPKNKRRVVYDPICSLRVNVAFSIKQ